MAEIKPFKAIRPTRDKAYLVPTRPFYAYKKNVLKEKIASNPFTFLHVINPEFTSENKTEPNSKERFAQVKQKFDEFIAHEIFVQDKQDSFYIYRQTSEKYIYTGIIAGASVESYLNNEIKKHEATLTEREETFTKYLSIATFNAEPVLLFHKVHQGLKDIYATEMKERPEYEFSTTQKIKHELWVINDRVKINKIERCFSEIKSLYIADGHHRSASSARYHKEYGASAKNSAYFLSYLISEDNLTIFDYNRLVQDLNGMNTEQFLTRIKENFEVIELITTITPVSNNEISMYLEGKWYKIKPKLDKVEAEHPVRSLDTHILNELLLDPILGITDLKTDKRIDFIEGTKGPNGIRFKVDSGKYKVGFLLHPISSEQLKAVADANMTMPPKSTWIEPKLRSGLTIYPLK